MHNAIDGLFPIVLKKANTKDVVYFHSVVNTVFHDVESKYYDLIHAEMWESLPLVFAKLVSAINIISLPEKIRLLDIGSGTGLSTALLLQTQLKNRISEITLLDSSSGMLEQSKKRFYDVGIPIRYVHGTIEILEHQEYDVILTCSVLHHIPDLEMFLKKVAFLTKPQGYFIHLHDPNRLALHEAIYLQRVQVYREAWKKKSCTLWYKFINKVFRTFTIKKIPNYIAEANEILLSKGIIHTPLTEVEMWSVTDIHVEGLPYSTNSGIDIDQIHQFLGDAFEPVKCVSYAFFGELYSELAIPRFQEEEKRLFEAGDLYGRNVACVWQKNPKN